MRTLTEARSYLKRALSDESAPLYMEFLLKKEWQNVTGDSFRMCNELHHMGFMQKQSIPIYSKSGAFAGHSHEFRSIFQGSNPFVVNK
jgi:hypothetical protein